MTAVLAAEAAHDLLRVALLAKLDIDLQDPALARRAAREAQAHARLLAGLDFAPAEDAEDAEVRCGPRLPAVQTLLGRLYPTEPDPEGEAA